jgi:hypothetical protein
MVMQTSIEWLVKSLSDRMYIHCPDFGHTIIDKLVEQAKEIHKQEIINAHNNGYMDISAQAEQYYLETFKKD